jgi:GH25 family lysozyme M1 (1,4-beta-N-acetylmuramidase)
MSLAAFSLRHGNYGTNFVAGVDVSGWQTPETLRQSLSWARFVWIKATQGTHFYEPATTAAQVAVCKEAGVPYGFYHFANQKTVNGQPVFANNGAYTEAAHFANAIHDQGGPGQLPPVLDYEAGGAPGDQSGWSIGFLSELEKLVGRRPMFYSYVGWIKAHISHAELGRYPLWLAHYADSGVSAEVPLPWHDWTVWQWEDETPEHGKLDVNVAKPDFLQSLGVTPEEDDLTSEEHQWLLDLTHRMAVIWPIIVELKDQRLPQIQERLDKVEAALKQPAPVNLAGNFEAIADRMSDRLINALKQEPS